MDKHCFIGKLRGPGEKLQKSTAPELPFPDRFWPYRKHRGLENKTRPNIFNMDNIQRSKVKTLNRLPDQTLDPKIKS